MKFNLCLALSAFILVGCGGTLAPHNVHQSPIENPVVVTDTSKKAADENLKLQQMKTLSADSTDESFLKNADSIYFDSAHWLNPRVSVSSEFTNLIDQVAATVLDLNSQSPQKLTDVKWWPRFSILVDQLCDDDLKNCLIFTVLKTSPRSAELMRQLAHTQTSIDKKYKYLFISLDLQNKTFPAATVEDFLLNAKEYRSKMIADIEALAKDSKPVELAQKQALLSKLNGILSLIISFVQEGKIQTTNTAWIRDLNLTASYKETDTELAAQYTVYEEKTKNLTSEFKNEITKMQNLPGSFSYKRKLIDAQNSKAIASFEVKPINLDEYFYVIDQVYTARWTVKQGEIFIHTAGLSNHTLLEVAQNYLRTDVVYIMTQAQAEMKEFVKDYSSVSAEKIINAAKKSLSHSSIESRALPEKAMKLSQLISISSGNNSAESNLFLKQVASVPQTIKAAITYPYTIMLLFLARRLGAASDTRLEVIKFSGEGNPKLSYFIKNLFNGSLIPILDYTDDVVPLNAFEVMEAFELSAKTGLFENVGLSLDEVTTTLYSLLTEEEQSRLSSDQSNLEEKYTSSEWTDLLLLCESYKKNTPLAHTIGFTELVSSPTLGEAASRLKETFGGFNSKVVDSVTLKEYGYFTISNRVSDQLEWIRSDLFNVIQYFDNMQKIVQGGAGLSMPKLKIQVEATKAAVKKFVTTLMKRDKEFDQCYFTIMNQERKYISQVIAYENAYWKLVHQEIKKMRANQKAVDLGAAALQLNLPKSLQYRTHITAEGVTSYNVDFFMRVKSYMQYGLPRANLPPILPQLDIAWTSGLDTQPVYRDSKTVLVPFVNSEDDFAKTALSASNIVGANNQTYWFNITYMNIYSFRDYYDAKATLYRMGPLAKKILGLDTLVSKDDLIQIPLRVVSYVNQTTEEQEAMKLLGISTRYSVDTLRDYGIFFDSTNENAAPLYDYLLGQLSQKWMATFGHADQWEDIRAGNAQVRPMGLVPVVVLGENFYRYQTDLKDQFSLTKLVTPSVLTDSVKTRIQDDLDLLASARDAVRAQANKSLPINSVRYSTQQELKIEYFSRSVFDNIDAVINGFHNRTGSYYRKN